MTKAKTAAAGSTKRSPQAQKKALARFIDTRLSHVIECGICDADDKVENACEEECVQMLHEIGWRHGFSKKFDCFCVMCPKCWRKPDSER
jgi:hypothetical protein